MKSSNAAGLTRFDVYFFLTLFFIFLGVIVNYQLAYGQEVMKKTEKSSIKTAGVCPPFYLLDENGQVINPVTDTNAGLPYSPKKTCGACHDYDKIVKGYHFTQGAGENPTVKQSERCQWVTTPGNYGGSWCSPAPLYRYLSSKNNSSPRMMDMTSFSFITAGCGKCHPGGGSAEYDRDGRRYDRWMADPGSGLTPGGDNRFDGDYYQARWSQTGVLEADCLMCHLPGYSFNARNKQLKGLNFRWAPTAAAGFGEVKGAVGKGDAVKVIYKQAKFNPDGTISPQIVREPRNQACLACHAKPGWKKRGANFRSRTDVHLRAGMKCIDCHPAGSKAVDDRIKGKEVHQFGKGDDPGGQVRNDLDNTCRDCVDCHNTGYLGAPIARHRWLPPLHLDRIACQTCHIPERAVKSALVQAGDVFNPGTKIPTKGKHLWTFYGPDMKYWNHYGDLEMMGYDDKPTDSFKPVLSRYKGKIFPVNRVHSTWPALELEGKTGLMQPRMSDIYKMWTDHYKDPAKYPELGKIKDDNQDGVPEINRPEEINALISSVTVMLKNTGYPMDGKKVVWVINDRVYSSGKDFRFISKQEWEASPYANVHKYNHDVYPAKAAIGINGCTDCHHPKAGFFFASVLKYPFDYKARPVTEPQYLILGLDGFLTYVGVWRETYLKPVLYVLLAVLLCTLIVLVGQRLLSWGIGDNPTSRLLRLAPWLLAFAIAVVLLILSLDPDLMGHMLPTRFWLDSNHFAIAALVITAGVLGWLAEVRVRHTAGPGRARGKFANIVYYELKLSLLLAAVSGILMLLKLSFINALNRAAYTIFDLSLALLLLGVIMVIIRQATSLPASHRDLTEKPLSRETPLLDK